MEGTGDQKQERNLPSELKHRPKIPRTPGMNERHPPNDPNN